MAGKKRIQTGDLIKHLLFYPDMRESMQTNPELWLLPGIPALPAY